MQNIIYITVSNTYIFSSAWEEMPLQLCCDTQANLQTLMDWTTCVHVIKNNAASLVVSHIFDS